MDLQFCRGFGLGIFPVRARKIVFVGLAFAAAAVFGRAAMVTVNIEGPVKEIGGSNPGLLAGVTVGTPLRFSYSYDSELAATQSLPKAAIYLAPEGTTLSAVHVGDVIQEFTNFQLDLFEDTKFFFGDESKLGDTAILFAWSTSATEPHGVLGSLFAQLIYPQGSFKGGPVLPSFAPSLIFLSYSTFPQGDANGAFAQSLVTQGDGLSPVPEPATYGLLAAVGLIGLAAIRGRKNFIRVRA
jgi:PEP-CTERM motif